MNPLPSMLPEIHSLAAAGDCRAGESIIGLVRGMRFRAESIVSRGTASPPGFWYDQDLPEWVVLLTGTASLEFEGGTLHLNAGDWLTIPAHLSHRVATTSADATWLALHYEADAEREI